MTGLLAELGRRLAERWFTLLVLPGAGYLLAVAIASTLGQAGWDDWRGLSDGFAALTAGVPGRQDALAVRAVLVIAAVVPASAGVGLLAGALARPVERLLCGQWPPPFAGAAAARTARRARDWLAADAAYAQGAGDPGDAERRNAIALIAPEHATWLGDRLRAPAVRLRAEYGIDLATVWPRLWLVLPSPARTTLAEARARLDAAFTLGGWAVLYLALGAWWWPAAAGGVVLGATAWARARPAAEAYAELVESTVDLHLPRLLTRLATRPSPSEGRALTERLRRGM